MGYRIEYDRGNRKYEVREAHPSWIPSFLGICAGLILICAVHFWPEETAMIRSAMIPGEDTVTVQAFQTMTDDLRSGATISDAVEAFCRNVIHGK